MNITCRWFIAFVTVESVCLFLNSYQRSMGIVPSGEEPTWSAIGSCFRHHFVNSTTAWEFMKRCTPAPELTHTRCVGGEEHDLPHLLAFMCAIAFLLELPNRA